MNFLASLLGTIGGGLNSALGLVASTMQRGFQSAIQFHKEGIAFARDVGLSAKQAQAYTDVLIQRTQVLANKYGVSADAIIQIQKGLSEATGKQLMLNDAQAESFVQIDKMMGAQARSKFTEEIMNGMGGQVDTVSKAMAKVYATAAKQGLNAKKLTDKVAQNLSMANRLSFRNGIDGITRMAALSEKLGINMQSVESAAGQFMDLDKAIENSAQMQMLGGSAAAMFGNPLTAAYEANYDPEAFAQRLSDSLGSYATFDASKGVASINGMNMDFVRNIAKAMNISPEEAAKMAKKQAEVKYKERQFGGQLDALGLSEDQKNFVINNAQVANGGKDLELNGKNINEYTPEELKGMMEFEGMSDKEILRQQAETLTSIDEQISGAAASVTAAFAEGVQGLIPALQSQIQELGSYFQDYAKIWGADTAKVIGGAMSWINEHKEGIKTVTDGILNGITKVFDWLSGGSLYRVLAAVIGWKVLKGVLGMSAGGGTTVGGRAASAVGKGLVNGAKWLTKSPVARIGGAALGVGLGAYKAFTADNNADRGEGIGTAAGAVIGTAIAGPLGAAVGGWLGGMGGKLIGEHWEEIKQFAKGAWDGIKDFAKGVWNLVPEDARNAISSGIEAITPIAKKVWDGIKVFAQAYWGAVKSVALGTWEVIKGAALGIWEVIKGTALGVWEVLKGVWAGLWDLISAPFAAISDVINGIKAGIGKITDGHILEGIGTMLGGLGKGIFDIISAPFKAIYDVGAGVFKGIGEVIKGVWNGIGEYIKGIWNGIKTAGMGVWRSFLVLLSHVPIVGKYIEVPPEEHAQGGFINEGAYGAEQPTLAQKGEVILNPTQQRNFMAMANDSSSVRAKEYGGEREYVYKPNGSETTNVGGNTVTVKDFNINLNGTLRLDAGNAYKNIDMNALLNDYQFMNALKEMIKDSINADMNGGRYMNDLATRRGQVSSSSIIGR